MNTETGDLYRIREELANRDALALEDFERVRDATRDELRALAALEAGQLVVPVSEQVAQKVMLGERELNRRERRRRRRAR